MADTKYKSIRILSTTYKAIKIEAAEQGIALSVLLDNAARREVKSGQKKRLKGEPS